MKDNISQGTKTWYVRDASGTIMSLYEETNETGYNAFELRLWDSRIGRRMTTDLYNQYHSPYLGMGNNPVMRVDADGGYDGPPDTWYLDSRGNLLFHSQDDLEDAVVIVEDDQIADFYSQHMVYRASLRAHDDDVNQILRNNFGPEYMIDQYWAVADLICNLDLVKEIGVYPEFISRVLLSNNQMVIPVDEVKISDCGLTCNFGVPDLTGDFVSWAHGHLMWQPDCRVGTKRVFGNKTGGDIKMSNEMKKGYYSILITRYSIALERPGSIIMLERKE
jgi:hypothetical protein